MYLGGHIGHPHGCLQQGLGGVYQVGDEYIFFVMS